MFTWLQSPGSLSAVAPACCSVRYIWVVCRILGIREAVLARMRRRRRWWGFGGGGIDARFFSALFSGCAAASNYLRGERKDCGVTQRWRPLSAAHTPRLPNYFAKNPEYLSEPIRGGQETGAWRGIRLFARQTLATILRAESEFDLLMRACRSERRALLCQLLGSQQKL